MVLLGSSWYDYLYNIYKHGQKCQKDDSDDIREILGVHIFLPRPQDSSYYEMNNPDLFLSLIESGVYDIDGYFLKGPALSQYVQAWDDEDMIYLQNDMDFVYTYPQRLFNYKTYDKYNDTINAINQYDIIVQRLANNLNSNRAVATLYNCGIDRQEQHIPCLNFLQGIVRNNKLILSCMFRSNDIFNAWPSNMYLLTYLGMKLANEFGIVFGGIDYHCSSAHYYLSEEPLVEDVLNSWV